METEQSKNSTGQKITPFLWFDNNAEEAINFYTSVFKNSRIVSVQRLNADTPSGSNVLTGTFEIAGQKFMFLNGGPMFKFTEAISFFINCETQGEVDELWQKLSAGGSESQCGWLKDKFGLSWQVIPSILGKLLNDKDPVKAQRVMQAMLKMKKIEISELEAAYHQK
jgi:predicted 3-demethylubiquinone-9 3-methyltransferase (glyoxalase superfamily)